MKRRYRNLLNLFAISLLLVALYLNFIKKEVAEVASPVPNASTINSGSADDKKSKITSPKQSAETIVLK